MVLFYSTHALASGCRDAKTLYLYYYINGMNNPDEQIDINREKIKATLSIIDLTLLRNPQNDPAPGTFLGLFDNSKTWSELKEVYAQKKQELEKSVLKENIVDSAAVTGMYDKMSEVKNNIIISHSQGNLYPNSLCNFNSNRKKQANLVVAVPANKIECGSKYITLEDDVVINELRNITKYSFGKIKSPLPSNAKLKINEICISNDILCHSLAEIYLLHETPLNTIRKHFSSIKEEIRKEDQKNQFVSIQLKELKQGDKGYLQSSMDKFGNVKSNVETSVRRTIASVKTIEYLSDIANSGFISSLMKFYTNKLTKKEFNKLLDTEIKVDSDEDLADVVGYVFDTVKGYCISYPKFVPSQISAYCKMSKDFYYFNPSEFNNSKGFNSYSLISSKMKWNEDSKVLSMTCEDVQGLENKDISIDLNYSPEYSKIVSLQISDFNYDVYPRNLLNQKTNRAPAATMSISLSNEGVYGYDIIKFLIK